MRTLKLDYVRVSPILNAKAVLQLLPVWLAHHNEVRPHNAVGYRSPREFIATPSNPVTLSGYLRATTSLT